MTTPDTQTLRDAIIHRGLEAGFVAVGVADAVPAPHHNAYVTWLASGMAAGMDYLHRHTSLREDPRRFVPDAASLVVVAARYPIAVEPSDGFSSYAQGLDYHDVLRTHLAPLSNLIRQARPGATCRVCVDSAPLAEREWALLAGIGWRGRQGQVVVPTAGCCVLLGTLLTSVKLPPTDPKPNQCGDCRRCLDACPTGALQENGLVDARKCISYLTIEHKGDLPADLCDTLNGALFGCDRCTSVCPWNREGADKVLPEFLPRPMPTAAALLLMTDAEFDARFQGTSIHRTGLNRLQRNSKKEQPS